eukprot:3788002-Amphidinium_carterae.1
MIRRTANIKRVARPTHCDSCNCASQRGTGFELQKVISPRRQSGVPMNHSSWVKLQADGIWRH